MVLKKHGTYDRRFLTYGDQIVISGTPGGGGSGGATFLNDLEDVVAPSPANSDVLVWDNTLETPKWVNVPSTNVGITDAGSVADLNASTPSNSKKVWSPSVLASWLSGKAYVNGVAVGGSDHSDQLAVSKESGTTYLTVPYATTTQGFKRIAGTAATGGYDLNTLLSGGGVTSNYSSGTYWANGPSGMRYGSAMQVNTRVTNGLALQLAWDVVQNDSQQIHDTGKLWWRDSTYHDSASDWGSWHLIYDDENLTANAVVSILGNTPVNRATGDDDGNTISSTYLKLSGGTMSGNITIPNGNAILNASSNTMLAVSSVGTVFYCGPGYEISSAFLLRSGDINLVHRKYTAANTYHDYAIWDSSNTYVSNSALSIGSVSLGSSSDPIGYATQAKRPFAIAGTQEAGGFDLNTVLAGGGAIRNVHSSNYWAHAPAGATYFGMAWQLMPSSAESGSMQFFWDGPYTGATPTDRLFWRLRNSTGWADDWHRIYDSANANLSTVDWNCKDLSVAGNITLANNKNINALDTASSARSLLYLSNSNNVVVGGGTKDMATGGTTYIDGKIIRLYTPNTNNAWTVAMLVNGNQNVTIGATDLASSNYKLYVNGDTYINGIVASTGDQVVTSDIRMKTNLKPIELSVEQIAKCRAVTFDWTTGGHSFGSIAQDWEPILPEAVHNGNTLSLAYAQLGTVIGINLAKHETKQDKEIRELRTELNNAKIKIKRLEAAIKTLKN